MYKIYLMSDGTFRCVGRLQDSTENWYEMTLKEAIGTMKGFARRRNGVRIKREDITFLCVAEGADGTTDWREFNPFAGDDYMTDKNAEALVVDHIKLSADLIVTQKALAELKEAVAKFLNATGHDLCHENRAELAAAAADLPTPNPELPPEEEFAKRCEEYRKQLYGHNGSESAARLQHDRTKVLEAAMAAARNINEISSALNDVLTRRLAATQREASIYWNALYEIANHQDYATEKAHARAVEALFGGSVVRVTYGTEVPNEIPY